MQIQSRLTLQFILIVAGIMLVAMFYIYFRFNDILQNEFYNTLRSKAIMTAEMTVNYSNYNQLNDANSGDEIDSGFSLYTENVSIYNLEYNRIYNFNPIAEKIDNEILSSIESSKEFKFSHDKHLALGIYYTNKNGESFIIVSEAIFNSGYLMILVRILVWVFIVSLVFVAIGGWVFAGQSLLPIRSIMNEVDAILPTNLNQRLETNNQNDELSRLVITFNKLLDRIQQTFNTQKMFLSNISHELKNPLSIIISQIEVILDKSRTETEYKQTLESVLDDIRELNDVSDRLMQLAKINSDSQIIEMSKVRIDELIWQSKAFLLKSHPRYKVHVEILNLPDEEEFLFINGNEQLLKTALFNLMDNGCKYSPDKDVRVFLSFSEKGGICVDIQDNGVGIPQNELPLVFEPFYRSSITNSFKGSGIGLSLVKSIMSLHNVKVTLTNNDNNIGILVKLIFPLSTK